MEIYGTNKYKVYLRIDNICRIIAKGLHSRPGQSPGMPCATEKD